MPANKASTTTAAWQRHILAFVAAHPAHPLKARALARELNVPNEDYITFRGAVRELLQAGSLVLGPGRTLRLPVTSGQVVGTFRATRRGFGFIERPGQPDVYIDRRRTGGALDGDTVAARALKPRGGQSASAEVTRIIERAPRRWVGALERAGNAWVVRPHGRNPLPPVHIATLDGTAARSGDLVVIEPDERTLNTRRARGTIVEELGDPRDARTWIRGVMRRFDIPETFPPAVRQAAQRAAAHFDPSRIAEREDLRNLLTITIDPPDARDYDDAFSIEPLSNDRLRLGVHIADVAHFVPLHGPVDREARQRGTSIYFPGLVVPMLPEVLSNEVCSLQPGATRLTKTVFLTYDQGGRVVDTRLASSVICSAARLAYPDVSAALDGHPGTIPGEVLTLLKLADTLARRIRQRRLKAGMLVLSLPEVAILLDESGHVVDAGPADTSFSHTIIEMFMVEANEAVSRALTQAGLPHLRRIHPAPVAPARETLAQLAPVLGQRPPSTLDRETIARLLATVQGRPEQPAVNFVLLRALSQACYSPTDEGHFALASADYCHFTSPIRRYPDLTIHRLFDVLRSSRSARRTTRRAAAVLSPADLDDLGRSTSAAERRAQQAERESDSVLLALLMESRIGDVFEGVITGVASFGVFVQIRPYMAEGVVRASDFGPDDWDYDRQSGVLVGRRTRRMVHLGQTVRVRVVAVDAARQEVGLVPADGLIGVTRHPTPVVIGARSRKGAAGKRRWVDKKRGHQVP